MQCLGKASLKFTANCGTSSSENRMLYFKKEREYLAPWQNVTSPLTDFLCAISQYKKIFSSTNFLGWEYPVSIKHNNNNKPSNYTWTTLLHLDLVLNQLIKFCFIISPVIFLDTVFFAAGGGCWRFWLEVESSAATASLGQCISCSKLYRYSYTTLKRNCISWPVHLLLSELYYSTATLTLL